MGQRRESADWTLDDSGDRAPADPELARLFEMSVQMLCVAGIDGYFKRVNPAFETALGYTADELLTRPFAEFVHPDDREATDAEVRKLARGLPTIRFENRYRCRDGRYRWLSWTAAPSPGRALIYATALDVTERKQAETLWRRLVEATPDAIVVIGAGGTIVLVNAMAERLFGYPREQLVGRPLEVLIPARLRAAHAGHVDAYGVAPRARPMGTGIELCGLRRDGTEFPADICLGPLEVDGAALVVATVRDLTERRQAQREQRHREAQLLAAREIQRHLLPAAGPRLAGFDVGGASHAAEFAAGDQFDYLPMPGGLLGIIVADVSGHGIGAALLMASTHAYLRLLAETSADPSRALERANRILFEETGPDRFVTLVFAVLDPGTGILRYASAGHPAGLVLGSDSAVKARLPSTSWPLGVVADAAFPEGDPVALAPGDMVLLCTDGLLDAESPRAERFGERRLIEAALAHRDAPAAAITAAVCETVLAFTGRAAPEDDLTLVVIKARPRE